MARCHANKFGKNASKHKRPRDNIWQKFGLRGVHGNHSFIDTPDLLVSFGWSLSLLNWFRCKLSIQLVKALVKLCVVVFKVDVRLWIKSQQVRLMDADIPNDGYKIINSYWTRLGKIFCFVNGGQINYSAEVNNWSVRHWQITIFSDNRVQKLFYHSVTEFVFLINFFGKFAFSPKSGEKRDFIYTWAKYYLQPNTVRRHCSRADHYL